MSFGVIGEVKRRTSSDAYFCRSHVFCLSISIFGKQLTFTCL